MKKYNIIDCLSDSVNAILFRAQHKETKQYCALMQFKTKIHSWEECFKLNEFIIANRIQSKNILKLLEIIRLDNGELILIYEDVESALSHFWEKVKIIKEKQIKQYLSQLLTAQISLYQAGSFYLLIFPIGYVHQNISTENIFVSNTDIIKLGNFSSCKDFFNLFQLNSHNSSMYYKFWFTFTLDEVKPPNFQQIQRIAITELIFFLLGVLWYSKQTFNQNKVELYNRKPLVQRSNAKEQLIELLAILGMPSSFEFPELHKFLSKHKLIIPQTKRKLNELVFNISEEGLDLLKKLLEINPKNRCQFQDILQHSYFHEIYSRKISISSNKSLVKECKFNDENQKENCNAKSDHSSSQEWQEEAIQINN